MKIVYRWSFDDGFFQIATYKDKWRLTVHLADGSWDILGSYNTPIAAADDIARMLIEFDLPFEIELSTDLPQDLSDWARIRVP